MTSELRVDKIIPTTGAPTNGGGGVIQVVSVTKTDTGSSTSTSTAEDVTGLTLSITPKFSTSKLLITCMYLAQQIIVMVVKHSY